MHILTEIVAAITVPGKPSPGAQVPKHNSRQLQEGLEELLQDNLR